MWLPEIVEHDDVAGLQCRNERVSDVAAEGFAVDWAIEHEGRVDAVVAADVKLQ